MKKNHFIYFYKTLKVCFLFSLIHDFFRCDIFSFLLASNYKSTSDFILITNTTNAKEKFLNSKGVNFLFLKNAAPYLISYF